MIIHSRLIGFVVFGLVLLAASAWATPSAIEGVVKDPTGRPVNGADVRIDAKAGNNFSKIVKTDAKGHYICSGLPVGNYKVTLIVAGSIKASINNATAKLGESTQLNFALAGVTGAKAKKATHMVYIPAETGSHLGGRWVEVDDNGNVSTAGSDNVQKVGADALRQMQNNSSGTSTSPNGGR